MVLCRLPPAGRSPISNRIGICIRDWYLYSERGIPDLFRSQSPTTAVHKINSQLEVSKALKNPAPSGLESGCHQTKIFALVLADMIISPLISTKMPAIIGLNTHGARGCGELLYHFSHKPFNRVGAGLVE